MLKNAKILISILFILCLLILVKMPPDKVSFGFYSSMCITNCSVVYTIDSCISKDTTILGKINNFKEVALINDIKFRCNENNQSFLVNIPVIMLLEPRSIIGKPDYVDQGGIFLRFRIFKIERSFLIDPDRPPFYFRNLNKIIQIRLESIQAAFNITSLSQGCSETPAYEFVLATGVTTIASTGSVSMFDETEANGRFKTDREFMKLTRVQYEKNVIVDNPSKTSAWQFWKSDKIVQKQKGYYVKQESLGNEINMDDYIEK